MGTGSKQLKQHGTPCTIGEKVEIVRCN